MVGKNDHLDETLAKLGMILDRQAQKYEPDSFEHPANPYTCPQLFLATVKLRGVPLSARGNKKPGNFGKN
jgi:hypothetical protein